MSNSKRKRVTYQDDQPSMTQQQFKNQCDINQILKKFEKTGMVTHVRNNQGAYGDFSTIKNFQDNLNLVINAQNAFDSLPAQIRKRFSNNPSLLLEFVQDDSNYNEALKLGLVQPKPEIQQPAPNDDKTTNTQGSQSQAT